MYRVLLNGVLRSVFINGKKSPYYTVDKQHYGVVMKKITIAILLSLSCGCAIAAVGCDNGDKPPVLGDECTITLQAGEGYSYIGEGITYDKQADVWTATARENATFSFSLDIGAFYAGSPTVTVDNVALAERDGVYTVDVTGDTEVKVDGIQKDVSTMVGTGAFDDAFVVTRPIDLLYIAEQVNAGNTNYSQAAYILGADIDCKGEEIEVIGNSAENFFSGCFTCVTNSETGAMERYTISNFTINTQDCNYVGLFGCVQTDMTVQSSGLFYGIRLENFTINASCSSLAKGNRSLYCGGLIGYGTGVRAYLCDAINGDINVASDASEFSFVGGLMGVQQAFYLEQYNQYFMAETAYAAVDVDVRVVQGAALYAGGIAGYLYTNSYVTPSYIHNSYATGNVSGAIRSGGIVGGLGQYSSVATSYSTGNVVAKVTMTSQTDGFLPEYCKAYAGGLVGYAENDTVVNDCFSVGKRTADAVDGTLSEFTHHAIAGGDEIHTNSVASRKYEIIECPETVDKSSLLQTLTEELGWQLYNWIIQDNAYPTINYESGDSVTTKVVVHYVDKDGESVKVNGQTNETYSYTDMYAPIADAFVNGFLQLYQTSDDKQLSFGYYFDKECTKPVPYSYLTTRNAEIYMGFTDPSPIVGEYLLATENAVAPVKVSILASGKVVCTDGWTDLEANYQFDGTTITMEGARLARYFTGVVDTELSMNEDAAFDMNRYMLYYFNGTLDGETLHLYDGVYFTAEAPLVAYKPAAVIPGAYYVQNGTDYDEYVFRPDGTGLYNNSPITYSTADGVITVTLAGGETQVNVSDLKTYNALKGAWKKSATVHKYYQFDGVNAWQSYLNVYERDMTNGGITASKENVVSGTYAINADEQSYTLYKANGDVYATATFDENGYLVITAADNTAGTYRGENGYTGVWDNGNGIKLTFDGINNLGKGVAVIEYAKEKVSYNLTYETSETVAPNLYLCLYYENAVFGYFTHNALYNTLTATVYDFNNVDTGYSAYTFYLVNDYDSLWVSDNATFDGIVFDGMGSYNSNGDWVSTLTIDNERIEYVLEKSTLSGYFHYDGVRYTLTFDDVQGIIYVNADTVLQRKDALADIDFVSVGENGALTQFAFNGKGNLTDGGELIVTAANGDKTTYVYKKTATQTNDYEIISGSAVVGTISENTNAYYDVTISDVSYEMYVRNQFIGDWAISGEFDDVFYIGPSDLDGNILATFYGVDVKIQDMGSDILSFSCEIDSMPVTYYMFLLYDNETNELDGFALSQYNSVVYGSYQFCSRVDELKGVWTMHGNENFTIAFDGVQSNYSNGIAYRYYKEFPTPYLYRVYRDANGEIEEILIWSQETYNESTLYYTLKFADSVSDGAYVKDGKVLVCEEADSLFRMSATDKDGYTYTFDGKNTDNDTWGKVTITKDGEATRVWEYDIEAFNSNMTANITIRDTATNTLYTAVINYRNSGNVTIELTEKTETEEACT